MIAASCDRCGSIRRDGGKPGTRTPNRITGGCLAGSFLVQSDAFHGRRGQIRTDTLRGLSSVSLPLDYAPRSGGSCGSRTRPEPRLRRSPLPTWANDPCGSGASNRTKSNSFKGYSRSKRTPECRWSGRGDSNPYTCGLNAVDMPVLLRPDGGDGRNRTLLAETTVLQTAPDPYRSTSPKWSARSESNRHCQAPRAWASAELGYVRMAEVRGIEPPTDFHGDCFRDSVSPWTTLPKVRPETGD
jgi:hypothetical protein